MKSFKLGFLSLTAGGLLLVSGLILTGKNYHPTTRVLGAETEQPAQVLSHQTAEPTITIVAPITSPKILNTKQLIKLNNIGNERIIELEKAISANKTELLPTILNYFIYGKQQIYGHWSQLSPTDKKTAKQACITQSSSLETNLLNLPEDQQMNGLKALASCRLILEQI